MWLKKLTKITIPIPSWGRRPYYDKRVPPQPTY
jgi:hypothetical protein